jgi:hypothetical protein
MPWYVKLIVGIVGISVLYYFLPIMDLLVLFWWVFVVPVIFLTCIWWAGSGTLIGLINFGPRVIDDLRTAVQAARETVKAEEAEAEA